MLDGAARLTDLMAATKASGMSAIATTDHGYLFGAFDFWSQATAAGIKPIIGVEAYVTPGTDRRDKTRVKWRTDESQKRDDLSGGGAYTHMTLLSRNNTGMRNLFKASSYASLDSVFSKWPRIDQDLLETYSEGLIATTGCPSGRSRSACASGSTKRPGPLPANTVRCSARTTTMSSSWTMGSRSKSV